MVNPLLTLFSLGLVLLAVGLTLIFSAWALVALGGVLVLAVLVYASRP